MEKYRIDERVRGVVERVTFHNPQNGWSVLRVRTFDRPGDLVTVTVHQTRVFAGATMEFKGAWTEHPRFGRQFKAEQATELKPSSAAALEKYLGSGLIKGVGPKTARRIVRHFGRETLDVFEHQIERLTEVQGIAEKKLRSITRAWQEHRAIRDVMIFLQSHGISTLFAVRIYKEYGDRAIAIVSENPYRLARDFYGIGFFSADRVALSLGFDQDSPLRIQAAIRHVLSASRELGHCYLTLDQITSQVGELLGQDKNLQIASHLQAMEQEKRLCVRYLPDSFGQVRPCYYSRTLYHEEEYVATRLRRMTGEIPVERHRIREWLAARSRKTGIKLSPDQTRAVESMAGCRLAILTGGPGCGKTTTTRTLVELCRFLGRRVMLAAPTGRAAQRMGEVIGMEAKTIHRLLEYHGTGFKRNEDNPLDTDVLIVDECSMLDISLMATLLKAVGKEASLLLVGDADQLPSVGAGNVLRDLIGSDRIPCFRLTTIFRQARESRIIEFAHDINNGRLPRIDSPFKNPNIWQESDCFFIDSEEATQQQLRFISRIRQQYRTIREREGLSDQDMYGFDITEPPTGREYGLQIPEQFSHVSLERLVTADSAADQLRAVLKKVHPWSSLYYGLTAVDVVRRLYAQWVPKYHPGCEVQVLCPMIRGSLGAASLNRTIQQTVNPPAPDRPELQVGERMFRVGDRVIHRRNNYELGVFNGDIGVITGIDNENLSCTVCFFPDQREVTYQREQIGELDLAYAITVHKAQGSEFDVVILPVVTQHFRMLFRNLLYTGLTRAKKLAIFVGSRRALAMAVSNRESSRRQTALAELLTGTV
ncbi:SF1B family DNA helicase RecD2 [Desulfolithobacter sp.]